MEYSYTKKVSGDVDSTVEMVTSMLSQEGFSVLMDINVQESLKQKLDVAIDAYRILGVCQPTFAYQALAVEKSIGLMLPCNLIVYEEKGDVFVATIVPTVAMSVVDNDKLKDIAKQVEDALKKVINNIT